MTTSAQHMAMEDILRLVSADAEAEQDYRANGFGSDRHHGIELAGTTVADILPFKLRDIEEDPEYYGHVRASMMQGQTAPLGVSPTGYLLNGGHRVAIALELGWTSMLVDSDFGDSTDFGFDAVHRSRLELSLQAA